MSSPSQKTFVGHCSHKTIVNDVIHNPYTLRALTGVMVRYCLGCGANGCAFRAEHSLVLKVSSHVGEAPIAEIIEGHGRVWPFLPIFYGSWIEPGETLGRQESVGITLREDLIDFSPDHPREYVEIATAFLDSAIKSGSSKGIRSLRRDLTPELMEMTSSLDAKAIQMIADFAVWSSHYNLGFDLGEFSGSLSITNLGQSLDDEAIVIRDLGNFEPEAGALSRLRRATMQRVRGRRQ